ncbi:hypothetical protein EYE40_15145 [Glaciihabitans arcticus]|uniref:Peptidase inhibitor family I36 n=1 Tax=Glaciihabitans arcticus TaxID=2668039 RepID=A0A4Q9GMJ5_9MICO|nr:peptidase inhibitor family I36 protein [Glaciihabitans arcticus]TBN55532.1 hypothetical protein EYE40_15145 [Glaciihabitans arcticus]
MKLKNAFALVALVTVLAGTTAGTAAVAGTGSDCPSKNVCLYDYYSFDGFLGNRPAGMSRTSISSGNNDHMASWINKMTTNSAWYPEASGGPCYTMSGNSTDSALAIGWRDTASSWRTTAGCP